MPACICTAQQSPQASLEADCAAVWAVGTQKTKGQKGMVDRNRKEWPMPQKPPKRQRGLGWSGDISSEQKLVLECGSS